MDRDLGALATAVLARILGPTGFVSADVNVAPEADGEESLLVTTHFAPEADIATGRAYIEAQIAFMEALAARGDTRFPYFRYDYPRYPVPKTEGEGLV